MKWRDQRQSTNIEDRRGIGGGGLAIGGGGLGIIIVLIAALVCGIDPRELLQNMPTETQVQQPGPASNQAGQPQDENRQFVGAIMGSTEDIWGQVLPQQARIK